MLSVIIATRDSERALVQTLAALVPGATAGLVSEVLIADGGSSDDTATVADVAGCNFLRLDGDPPGKRLRMAAASARAPWLMFLRPGIILDSPWVGNVTNFINQPTERPQAAVFRSGGNVEPPLRQAWRLIKAALGALPRPEQGLILAKPLYVELGGHSDLAREPETHLLRRIGRRRIVTLSTAATG